MKNENICTKQKRKKKDTKPKIKKKKQTKHCHFQYSNPKIQLTKIHKKKK